MTAAAKKTATSQIDELKRRIGAEQNALDRLQLRAVELQEERKVALLADDDGPLAEVEASILANLQQAERHRARLDAALADLEVAEEAQRQAQARAAYEAAARQLAEAERWLMTSYPKLAAELAAGLSRLQTADRLAERLNRELPAGCEPLRPPSHARHESMTPDRREVRKVRRWIDQAGRDLGAVQLVAGEPTTLGARLVEVEEEVVVAGRRAWWPVPVYTEVQLPRLRREDEDFWMP